MSWRLSIHLNRGEYRASMMPQMQFNDVRKITALRRPKKAQIRLKDQIRLLWFHCDKNGTTRTTKIDDANEKDHVCMGRITSKIPGKTPSKQSLKVVGEGVLATTTGILPSYNGQVDILSGTPIHEPCVDRLRPCCQSVPHGRLETIC